jgi:hypothetical protein
MARVEAIADEYAALKRIDYTCDDILNRKIYPRMRLSHRDVEKESRRGQQSALSDEQNEQNAQNEHNKVEMKNVAKEAVGPHTSDPLPYRILCESHHLSLHNTILYFAYDCKHEIEKWDISAYNKRMLSVWTERLKGCMRRKELSFLEKLAADTLLRLCWLVCIFNHLDEEQLVLLTPPDSYEGPEGKFYVWEAELEGCILPQATSGAETFKRLAQGETSKRARDAVPVTTSFVGPSHKRRASAS